MFCASHFRRACRHDIHDCFNLSLCGCNLNKRTPCINLSQVTLKMVCVYL